MYKLFIMKIYFLFLIATTFPYVTQAETLNCLSVLTQAPEATSETADVDSTENTSNTLNLAKYEGKSPGEILNEMAAERERITEALTDTEQINRWYHARNWFRRHLGARARRRDSQIAAKLLRLKEAVRKGDSIEVWKLIDKTFLKAERAFYHVYTTRQQVVALNQALEDRLYKNEEYTSEKSKQVKEIRSQIRKNHKQIEKHLKALIPVFDEYKALRRYLEYEATNPVQGRQSFAQDILNRTGLNQKDLEEYEKIRTLLKETFPNGYDLSLVNKEVEGDDYKDGTERPLAEFGRWYSLKSQTYSLGLMYAKSWTIEAFPSLTRILDKGAEGLRKTRLGGHFAPLLNIFTGALNDIEAIRYHLIDIMGIEAVYSSEQPDQLAAVMSQYGNRDMTFLTNMARSFEHKKLLWEIMARIALEGSTGEVHVLEQYLKDRSEVEDLRIEISILQKDLNRIRNGANLEEVSLNVDSEVKKQTEELLEEKLQELKELETGVAGASEEGGSTAAFSENLQRINQVIDDVINDDPLGRYGLMYKIRLAQQRALEMPPLSYELTTGHVLKDVATNVVLYYITLKASLLFVPDETERAFMEAIRPETLF